ncbi:alanine racemase [Alkalilimnicola sp. S0819]|uniref:alanine racemase n=1 Tax=Alkalilimnicola sp. S0819 TaxID=2613922 RepID=UPI001261D575|nr:alanine racemase [Alkalilimnicola sp. S0819]KAB7628367.1 alanine racemase [Alkalilimnicola sp. S0819]MPQ15269.1 alanine racemase [Alkalilimnicola sp. S0819]
MSRGTRALIDLAALRHNFALARAHAEGARVMAVIKAGGYGHGLRRTAQALPDADAFGVTSLEEALPLRAAGISQPILLLEGIFTDDELAAAAEHELSLVVHSEWQLAALERCELRAAFECWLKINSGMNRLGVPGEQAAVFERRLQACPAVRGTPRLMTHLAAADDRGGARTPAQLESFRRSCEGLTGERSLANSAGLLGWPAARADWVRPGIMLYGVSPFVDGGERPDLRPVMTLESQLIAINQCRAGDRIGYAGAYTCPEDMAVGVVSIGYGDGYPRHASTGTPVLLNGRRTQLLGRVSMDMICIDLRGQADARVHDPVVLWGQGLPAEEVAAAAGTIAYELFCRLTNRVRFEYHDG